MQKPSVRVDRKTPGRRRCDLSRQCQSSPDIDWWVEFKKKFPDITIIGGLHVNAEMENGTEEDVENRGKEVIKKLGVNGRLVITPTCCMPWRVPLNNIRAVVRAVEKYGHYPLNID